MVLFLEYSWLTMNMQDLTMNIHTYVCVLDCIPVIFVVNHEYAGFNHEYSHLCLCS